MAVLRTGSQGQEVRDLQRALTAVGYKVGVDGTYGPETRKAVMAYQKANGLSVDGEVGKDTKGNLQIPFLRQGDSGDRVKALQRDLKRSGESLQVDGVFGPETKKAVQNFQTNAGIGVDGVVGNETYGEIAKTIRIPTPRPNMAAEAATDVVPDTGEDMAGGPEEPSVPLDRTPTQDQNLQTALAGAPPGGMDTQPAIGQPPMPQGMSLPDLQGAVAPQPGPSATAYTDQSAWEPINATKPESGPMVADQSAYTDESAWEPANPTKPEAGMPPQDSELASALIGPRGPNSPPPTSFGQGPAQPYPTGSFSPPMTGEEFSRGPIDPQTFTQAQNPNQYATGSFTPPPDQMMRSNLSDPNQAEMDRMDANADPVATHGKDAILKASLMRAFDDLMAKRRAAQPIPSR